MRYVQLFANTLSSKDRLPVGRRLEREQRVQVTMQTYELTTATPDLLYAQSVGSPEND
jgi:hypothetical protein